MIYALIFIKGKWRYSRDLVKKKKPLTLEYNYIRALYESNCIMHSKYINWLIETLEISSARAIHKFERWENKSEQIIRVNSTHELPAIILLGKSFEQLQFHVLSLKIRNFHIWRGAAPNDFIGAELVVAGHRFRRHVLATRYKMPRSN